MDSSERLSSPSHIPLSSTSSQTLASSLPNTMTHIDKLWVSEPQVYTADGMGPTFSPAGSSTDTNSPSESPQTSSEGLEIAGQKDLRMNLVLNLGRIWQTAQEKRQQGLLNAERKKKLEKQLNVLKEQLVKLQQDSVKETPPALKNLEKKQKMEVYRAKLLKAKQLLKARQKRREDAENVKLKAEERLKAKQKKREEEENVRKLKAEEQLKKKPSKNMHFEEVSVSPPLDGLCATVMENGDSNSTLTPSAMTCIREFPCSSNQKSPTAAFPGVEMFNRDLDTPLPIPEEMKNSWWRISSPEELREIMNNCHPRGIREKNLKKQIMMNMDWLTRSCFKDTDVDMIDVSEVRDWCFEEQAMKLDVAMLRQVEAFERKVVSAGLHFKAYKLPKPESKRDDLVYYDHSAACKNNTGPTGRLAIVRRHNNPLDIAVMRLSELEQNIGKRYKKAPDPEMRQWKKAMREACSSAKLSLCLQYLHNSIMWTKSTTRRRGKRNSKRREVVVFSKDKAARARAMPKTKRSTAKKRKQGLYAAASKKKSSIKKTRTL